MFGESRNFINAAKFQLLILPIILFLSGCGQTNSNSQPIHSTTDISSNSSNHINQAKITFQVEVPGDGFNNTIPVFLEVLDYVTGSSVNPQRYALERVDDTHQKISISETIGSILKYRYIQGTNPSIIEHTLSGEQVQFRAFPVTGSDLIEDHIAAWTPLPAPELPGRIQGVIKNTDNQPLVNIMVCAAGYTTLTASDGSYLIEDLPPGKHLLTAFSLDGSNTPFYQEAVIASNLTTPANIYLAETKLVNVTFLVNPPPGTIQNTPMRIIGDLFQLGNVFTELNAGAYIIPSRAPLLSSNSDGTYQITLALPAGYNLRYKYTIGDGFWNAEHTFDGDFNVRELFVPQSDFLVNDTIDTWNSGSPAPVTFHVTIPPTTDDK